MARFVLLQHGQLITIGTFPTKTAALKWARDRCKVRLLAEVPFWNGQITIAQLRTIARHKK